MTSKNKAVCMLKTGFHITFQYRQPTGDTTTEACLQIIVTHRRPTGDPPATHRWWAPLRREFYNRTEMQVIFSGIEAIQTSETASYPPATYRSHVSIKISPGRRYHNGKEVEQASTFLRCLR